jgi:hypothetical protein
MKREHFLLVENGISNVCILSEYGSKFCQITTNSVQAIFVESQVVVFEDINDLFDMQKNSITNS